MMKKKAKEELIAMLEKHKRDIGYELTRNKSLMRDITHKQTIQKRKLAELNKIIQGLKI